MCILVGKKPRTRKSLKEVCEEIKTSQVEAKQALLLEEKRRKDSEAEEEQMLLIYGPNLGLNHE